jgi:hypothetical protein
MTRRATSSGHVHPWRWVIPVGICLVALASWLVGGDDRAIADMPDQDVQSALPLAATDEAEVEEGSGPLAPELSGGGNGEEATAAGHAPTLGGPMAEWAARVALAPPASATTPVRPLARFEALTLHTPTTEPVLVGFHEAGTRDGLALEPVGPLIANDNATRGTAPPDDPAGTPYRIMHSRGRPAGPTTAVDIVMQDGEPVLAPVDGTVTDVRSYYLGGRYEDLRVEIRPDSAPDLRVVLIHLDDLEVRVGDPVQRGSTVLAGTARRFPFASQIDYLTEPERWPHVHLELKHESASRPGDG